MKTTIIIIIYFLATIGDLAGQVYSPSTTYTGDVGNRVGHSNSTPSDNYGGKMNSPSEIIQVGSNVIIAGMSGTDLGDFFLHKKNANTGASVNMTYVFLNDFLGLPIGVNKITGMKYDSQSDRIYVYGISNLPGYSGFIICYNQTSMTIDTSFDFDGLQMFYSGDQVQDVLIIENSRFVALVNNGNNFKLIEILNGGQWVSNLIVGSTTKTFSARRIKSYPSKSNRYYVVGKIQTGGSYIPGIWGFDRITIKNYTSQFQQICTNNQNLSVEGNGEFEDLCFPLNNNTGICDIVAVGNSSIGTTNTGWSAESSGIFLKYKGNLSSTPYNLVIDFTFKNQSVLPGVAIASNLSIPNKAYFTRCEALGPNIMVLGSDQIDNNATVGFINSSGTIYNRLYIAPFTYIGATRVHFPRGFYINSLNQIFLTGCDTPYGLTSIKLNPIPN